MFDIITMKEKIGKRSIMRPSPNYDFNIFERPLPYYSTIPEQRWTDARFRQLTRQEKGDYCLLADFLWLGCGAIRRCDISRFGAELDMPEQQLILLIEKLLRIKLLVEIQEWLVQPELREQYLYVCGNNNSKKCSPAMDEDSCLDESF